MANVRGLILKTKVRGKGRMPLLSSTNEIIAKFKKKHGDRYDYGLVVYKGSDCPVTILCKKHGSFIQRADQHLRGNNCPKCAKRYKPTTDEFISYCKNIFQDKFDYSKTEYINTRTAITVICKEHGEFTVSPYNHKNSASGGCPKCNKNRKLTLKEFISNSNKRHQNKYDYSLIKEFKNTRGKVNIKCEEHGVFTQIADQHLRGRGCPKCGIETSMSKTSMGLEEFINKSNKLHESKYDYSKVVYKNSYSKVEIICPIHGSFWQRPHGHLQTRGCMECGDESKFNFSRKRYIEHCDNTNNGMATLYLIRCSGNNESFYKCGITMKSIEQRFKGVMPYDYAIVATAKEKANLVWDMEHRIHNILSEHQYLPKINFGGATECFSEVPKSVVKLISSIDKDGQIQLIT